MGTKIEWADEVWNPITGCSPISAGCKNCWARRMAKRLAGRYGYPEAPHQFDVTLHPERLEQPLQWHKPRHVFVCSMGDLFHRDVSSGHTQRVFQQIAQTPQHTYLILTKRPHRMKMFFVNNTDVNGYLHMWNGYKAKRPFPNTWLGVSVENQKTADERIPLLLQIPAAVRFVSYEPALGPIDITRYLCYNEPHGHTTERNQNISSSAKRRTRNRRERENLEDALSSNQSVDRSVNLENMQAETRRTSHRSRLSPDSLDERQDENKCRGSQTSMVSLLRTNSQRIDDQSQEWNQERQQTREFGISNAQSTDATCGAYTGDSALRKSTRREAPQLKVDRGTGNRNSSSFSPQTCHGASSSRKVQGESANDFRYSTQTDLETSPIDACLQWIVAGCESGPGARPMDEDWVRDLRDQCVDADIPFFYKQKLVNGKRVSMPELDGKVWNQYPKGVKCS